MSTSSSCGTKKYFIPLWFLELTEHQKCLCRSLAEFNRQIYLWVLNFCFSYRHLSILKENDSIITHFPLKPSVSNSLVANVNSATFIISTYFVKLPLGVYQYLITSCSHYSKRLAELSCLGVPHLTRCLTHLTLHVFHRYHNSTF